MLPNHIIKHTNCSEIAARVAQQARGSDLRAARSQQLPAAPIHSTALALCRGAVNHGCGFVLLAAQVSALPRPSWSQDSPTGSSVPKEGAHGDSSQGDTELPASLAVIFHYETAPYLGSLRNVTQGHDGWESAYWASPCCLPNRRGILPVSCLDCGGSAGHGPSGSSSAHSGGCPVPPPKLWVTRGVCAPSTTRQQHLQSERQHAALLPCCFISTPVGSLILAGGCSCLALNREPRES